MDNPGYNLVALPINPAAPDYALTAIQSARAGMDHQYLYGNGNSLTHYYAVRAAYIENETRLRDSSPDPKNYKPHPFTGVVPRRETYDWDPTANEGNGGFDQHFLDPDPSIPSGAPELPPYVAPPQTVIAKPSGPGSVSSSADVAALAVKVDALTALVAKIAAFFHVS